MIKSWVWYEMQMLNRPINVASSAVSSAFAVRIRCCAYTSVGLHDIHMYSYYTDCRSHEIHEIQSQALMTRYIHLLRLLFVFAFII